MGSQKVESIKGSSALKDAILTVSQTKQDASIKQDNVKSSGRFRNFHLTVYSTLWNISCMQH